MDVNSMFKRISSLISGGQSPKDAADSFYQTKDEEDEQKKLSNREQVVKSFKDAFK